MSIRRQIRSLADVVRVQAARRGSACALWYRDRQTSYAQLDAASNQVAHGLIALGAPPQSRVLILEKNSDRFFELLFGCAKARMVAVPVNLRLSSAEIGYIAADCQSEIAFVNRELWPMIAKLREQTPRLKKIFVLGGDRAAPFGYEAWRDAQNAHAIDMPPGAEDVALQVYTSGTTGHPKGVQLAHRSFLALLGGMAERGDNWIGLDERDVVLQVVPFFHIGGTWWGVQALIAGAKNVVLDAFLPTEVLALVGQHRITRLGLVPAMIQLLLLEPRCKTTDFSSVTHLVYGGAPIAVELQRKAMEILQCDLVQMYGMTETGNMAVCLREHDHDVSGNARMQSAGRALPGVEVRIVGASGEVLPPGNIGEVYIRSPAGMVGYWNQDDATKATLADGWVRTGDAASMDADGYVYIRDRVKDMIISAGENIYPAEIERVLCSHPAVAEAAVIGVPDERWGEVVKAFVVLKPALHADTDDLQAHCRRELASFKLPRAIALVDALPRNASGKLLKRELRAQYWAGRERQVN